MERVASVRSELGKRHTTLWQFEGLILEYLNALELTRASSSSAREVCNGPADRPADRPTVAWRCRVILAEKEKEAKIF